MADKVRCVIVSGAPDNDLEFIQNSITCSDYIIAADSGYKKLDSIGIKPDLIAADFDSSDLPEYSVDIIQAPVEKDSTDTFNAVKTALKKGFKNILILGALGGRIDHTYSNILCIDYADKHGSECVIADRNNRISIIKSRKTIVKDYKWFSLFAFLEDCKGIRISGAHYGAGFYNLETLNLNQGDQLGQSNYIESEECTISVEQGRLLLIESNDY